MGYTRATHGLHTSYPCANQAHGQPWASDRLPMGYLCATHGLHKGYTWAAQWLAMG